MPTADPAADGYALALEEARRALDEQERASPSSPRGLAY